MIKKYFLKAKKYLSCQAENEKRVSLLCRQFLQIRQ